MTPSQTKAYLQVSTEPLVGARLLDSRPVIVVAKEDGAVLWCNVAALELFPGATIGEVLDRRMASGGPAARAFAGMAESLPLGATRLEMLRLGPQLGLPRAFAVTRLRTGDRDVLLLVADGPATNDPPAARARRLVDTFAASGGAAAILADDGAPISASFDLSPSADALGTLLRGGHHGIFERRIAADGGAVLLGARIAAGDREVVLTFLVPGAPAGAEATAAEGHPPPIEHEPADLGEAVAGAADVVATAEAPDVVAPLAEADREAGADEPEPPHAVRPAEERPSGEQVTTVAAAPGPEPAAVAVEARPSAESPTPPAAARGEGLPLPPNGSIRFVFQMDAAQRFTMVSPEFAEVVGRHAGDIVGRSFSEVVERLDLTDTDGIAAALARRDTWSGVTLYWPVDGQGDRIAVDLAALPAFAQNRTFEGFRGFGVCRGGDRRTGAPRAPAPDSAPAGDASPAAPVDADERPTAAEATGRPSPLAEPERPSNVVRLPGTDRTARPAILSGVEQDAFRRIAEALGRHPPIPEPTNTPEAPAISEATASPGPAPVRDVADVQTPPPEPAETELRILDRLPLGILMVKADQLVYANQRLLDMLGYGSTAAFRDAGGIGALFLTNGAGWMAQDESERPAELTARRADGTTFPASARMQRVLLGDTSALLLTLTERPAAAGDYLDELRLASDRINELEAILDTATDGVVVVDSEGRIGTFNRAAEALFGVEGSDVLGKPFVDLLAVESRKAALDYLDGLTQNGVASVLNDGREVIGKVGERGLIPLFMTMGRVGATGEFCAVLRDITQWKKAEEDLISARRAAEAANSQKSDFLAKISHEIRTPLNAVIGFSEVMVEERFGPIGNERYKEYLRDIHLSGSHLMSLINDLLDLSKIEAGKIELSFDSVAINNVLRDCVALMQPQANRERIIIRTSLAGDIPNVVADPRSLRQIVLNLLSNAVKFTLPGGQVIVSSSIEENGEVVIRIRDTGVGMSEKDIEAALKPFRQLSTSGRERFDGTGLGLPLTKAMVEANRAAFAIDSAIDQGTMVRITFPPPRVLAG